jgi:ribosome-binding factor A
MSAERRYSRLDRVNEVLRQVIADELERVDDEKLELVTITGVKAEADLRQAVVWFDTLKDVGDVAEALTRHRVRLQAAIGRELHLKRTPGLTFAPDPAIAAGTRVEAIIRDLHRDPGLGAPPVGEDGLDDGA